MPNPTFLISIPEFTSRGIDAPQCGQLYQRADKPFDTRFRQIAQCWDVPAGLTLMTNRPAFAALYGRISDLEDATFRRCQVLLERQDFIQGLTNFYWWEEAVNYG